VKGKKHESEEEDARRPNLPDFFLFGMVGGLQISQDDSTDFQPALFVNQQTINFIRSFVRQLPLPSGHSHGSINALGVETAEKWWFKKYVNT
jgi:hypothetical protein